MLIRIRVIHTYIYTVHVISYILYFVVHISLLFSQSCSLLFSIFLAIMCDYDTFFSFLREEFLQSQMNDRHAQECTVHV